MEKLFAKFAIENGVPYKVGIEHFLALLQGHDLNHPDLQKHFDPGPADGKMVWTLMINLSPEEQAAIKDAVVGAGKD